MARRRFEPVVKLSREFSYQERRELALQYSVLMTAEKAMFREEHKVSREQISRWIKALADGDLEKERFPRKTGVMTYREVNEIRRMEREHESYRKKLMACFVNAMNVLPS